MKARRKYRLHIGYARDQCIQLRKFLPGHRAPACSGRRCDARAATGNNPAFS
jgi:hypothetical protein